MIRLDCPAGTVTAAPDEVDGLAVLRARGIRYARAERFAPPVPEPDVEPAGESGGAPITSGEPSPACPQPASALLEEMFGGGFGGLGEDEACQRLSVTLPGDVTAESVRAGERLPVMVFLHGGSYVYGAADVPVHDPATLVAEQRVIVVGVTYRLGVFGFLGGSLGEGRERPANLGLLDQLEALRWVQRNIAALGGDPENVTVFGESAGADAIAHLVATPAARGLFGRAILQSPPLGIARGRAAMSAAMLALTEEVEAATPSADVVALHERLEQAARPFGLVAAMPFGTQYGHHPLPAEDDVDAAWRAAAPEVEVLIGSNAREAAFFVPNVPPAARLGALPVVGGPALELVCSLLSWRVYGSGIARFAQRHAEAGGRALTYTLTWGAPGNPLRSAHTIDLALLFPSRDAWAGSPLVAGVAWEDVVAAGRPVRAAWAQFARTGALAAGHHGAALRVAEPTAPRGILGTLAGVAGGAGRLVSRLRG
ncbi:carboxylesterase family protein [Nocardioides nanhaiensis]|uniref:carboxylesterase family protein n=1 Tax=Nocardioides nanhaiensis TaxID=1476871 RepID=UPI0031E92D9F